MEFDHEGVLCSPEIPVCIFCEFFFEADDFLLRPFKSCGFLLGGNCTPLGAWRIVHGVVPGKCAQAKYKTQSRT